VAPDLESFKGGNFNTLSLVDVQICNGTAVEHGSLLNCSGVCDGINCCKNLKTAFNLVKIHLLFRIMILIQ
jgi:hypothetical protein